jgi:hypothetical protein
MICRRSKAATAAYGDSDSGVLVRASKKKEFLLGLSLLALTGDSGSGDLVGPFKSSVDAIGPGLSYTTLIGKTPFIFNLRHYTEFNATNHWEANSTIASGTIRF